MIFLSILLQAQGNNSTFYVMLLLMMVVFYFFMIRPQVKKQKEEKNFRETLQKGAKVVTIGGIHGRILEVSEKTFMLEIDTNVRVKVEKSAISKEATKALEVSVPAATK